MSRLPTIALPADARVHKAVRLVTWHPRGVLDIGLAREVLSFMEAQESTGEAPFHRFTDLSGLEAIHLGLKEVEELAEIRSASYEGPPVKSAVLASNPLSFGVAQMYGQLIRASLIEVRIFCLLTSASAWLEMPIELMLSSR